MNNTIENVTTTLPLDEGLQIAPLQPLNNNFIDIGLLGTVDIPLRVNRTLTNNPSNSGTVAPIFGLMATDRYILDFNAPDSVFMFPNPATSNLNVRMSLRPISLTHPNTAKAASFAGWRGTLKFLFQFTTNAVVQGSISIMKLKGATGGSFGATYPPTNTDDPNSNVILNLATDRMATVTVDYDETTQWVDSYLWHMKKGQAALDVINIWRNMIIVRPNTDIVTFDGSPSQLSFKVFVAYDHDFEFLFPGAPVNPRLRYNIGVSDIYQPFTKNLSVFVGYYNFQSPYEIWIHDTIKNVSFNLRSLDDNTYEVTLPFTETWYIDSAEVLEDVTHQWYRVISYVVTLNLEGELSAFVTFLSGSGVTYQQVSSPPPPGTQLFMLHSNFPDTNDLPPYVPKLPIT